MSPAVRAAINEHCIAQFPREACGLVIDVRGEEFYFPCRNIAVSRSEHFVLNPHDYAAAEDAGSVMMVVHSHPNGPARPSQADKVECERGVVPWMIVAVHKEANDIAPRIAGDHVFKPSGFFVPYVGRQYQFGVQDCYTLLQDWYQREWGVTLPDIERQDGFWLRAGGPELYLDNYERAGFAKVTDGSIAVGDMILMRIRSKIQVNHGGVYVGDGKILHHMYQALSRCELYSSSLRERTVMVVRRTDR